MPATGYPPSSGAARLISCVRLGPSRRVAALLDVSEHSTPVCAARSGSTAATCQASFRIEREEPVATRRRIRELETELTVHRRAAVDAAAAAAALARAAPSAAVTPVKAATLTSRLVAWPGTSGATEAPAASTARVRRGRRSPGARARCARLSAARSEREAV